MMKVSTLKQVLAQQKKCTVLPSVQDLVTKPDPFLSPVYCIKSFPFPPFTHFHLHKLKLPFQYRLPLLSFHLQVFALNFPPER